MKKFLTIPQSLVKKFFSLFCFEIITCLFFEDSFNMRLKSSKLTFSYELFANETLENDLIRNEVIIEATFNEGIDASWVLASDESSSYKLSDDKRNQTIESARLI